MRDEQSESLGLIVPSCCSKIDLLFGGFLSHINSLSSLFTVKIAQQFEVAYHSSWQPKHTTKLFDLFRHDDMISFRV